MTLLSFFVSHRLQTWCSVTPNTLDLSNPDYIKHIQFTLLTVKQLDMLMTTYNNSTMEVNIIQVKLL